MMLPARRFSPYASGIACPQLDDCRRSDLIAWGCAADGGFPPFMPTLVGLPAYYSRRRREPVRHPRLAEVPAQVVVVGAADDHAEAGVGMDDHRPGDDDPAVRAVRGGRGRQL